MAKETVGKLKKKLDTIYSRYIRLKHADFSGYVPCVSCGLRFHWKKIQNGHYVSRRYSNLRYDERNTKPQCMGCNMYRGGNHANFAIALQQEYGEDIIKTLAKESNVQRRFTVPELREMLNEYRAKLKEIDRDE